MVNGAVGSRGLAPRLGLNVQLLKSLKKGTCYNSTMGRGCRVGYREPVFVIFITAIITIIVPFIDTLFLCIASGLARGETGPGVTSLMLYILQYLPALCAIDIAEGPFI